MCAINLRTLLVVVAVLTAATIEIRVCGGEPITLDIGSSCSVKSSRPTRGVCKPLNQCQSALSDYIAGVNPTICTLKNNVPIVCCRVNPRISKQKCAEYVEVLANEDRPLIPLLPTKFLEAESNTKSEVRCGRQVNELIVGGRGAKFDELPHMVALGFNSPNGISWGCGGTLISEEFVLTAAHCIDAPNLGLPVKVLLGDITLKEASAPSRLIVGISEYIKHPEYEKPSSYNDIALLRLDRKVSITRSTLPACLPDPESRFDKKVNLTAAGWGRVGYAENQSDILQVVNLTRTSLSACNEHYRELPLKMLKYPNGIWRKQFCAGDPKSFKDTCQGDSGGPLTTNLDKRCIHYVVGITSFGLSFCGSSTPAVYTNVQSYLDWIEDILWPED